MAYTNSPLVSYTLLSPNNSGQRTHAIDRITPHCVVGQCSVESLGSLFANPSRQASSNYGIGSDGRVGMYCEEKNRSWCSSSNANDQRAVTIECASDNFAPYAFKEVVYNKLVDLCVDICQRNGKNRIIWLLSKDDNKNYNPKEGEMQLTVHRYVGSQATSCPGDWMMARMQDLADKVNARLGASSSVTPSTPSSSTDIKPIAIPTISYEKTIWTYMKGKLSNDYAVAAMLGNMYAESGLKSDNLENKKESVLGYTDATYTSAVDKNTYKYFDSDGAGYGLIQWRTKDRKANLLSFAKSAGKSVGDLNAQLDYVWQELTTTYKDLLKDLKMAKSVNDATAIILKQYIQPIGQLEDMKNKRIGYAMTYLSRYGGSTTPSTTPSTPSTTPSTPSTPTQTNSDEKKIWDYLYARIGNAYGVAGLMGNLHAESGLRSNNLQNSFEKKYGMNDEQYCAAVDNGQISEYDFVHDGSGLGLAQWTWWTRKQNLYNMLRKERKVSIANLDGQLDYLWKELSESYKGVLNSLKIAKSVREASDVVLTQFEKPANQSEEVKKQRAGYGEAFYARYANGSANITPSTPTSGNNASGIKVGGGKYIWQGLDYAPVFNPSYYTQRYEDLKNTFGTNELGLFNHFVTYGMKECRQASANFNVITYRNRYEDLIKAFGNDMPAYYKHYIEYGIKENRTGV